MTLARLLRQLRAGKHVLQSAVCEATGISSQTLSFLENGNLGLPHKSTIQKLANYYGEPLPRNTRAGREWVHPEVSE